MAAPDDPVCTTCGERRSAHVPTESGPLTHPREARGEGIYELVSPAHIASFGWPGDDANETHMPARYLFVPRVDPLDEARAAAGLPLTGNGVA